MATLADLRLKTSPIPRSRMRRARRRFLLLVAFLLVALLCLPSLAVAEVERVARIDDRAPTDAILVLGAAQYQGAPSRVLANRLAHAKELTAAGVAPKVITVGGFKDGDVTSEAQAGKVELVAEGLTRADVIAVPFGANTAESIENVATIAGQQGIGSVTIVTDPAHSARAQTLAERFGLEAHISPTQSGPGTSLDPGYVTRESAGLLAVWLGW